MNTEVLTHALGNVIAGMGTVFTILVIIMCIIFAFNIIPVIEKKFKKTAPVAETKVSAPKAAPVPAAAAEEVPVAVIAAAIAAYEEEAGFPPGSFVVRSIKRRF